MPHYQFTVRAGSPSARCKAEIARAVSAMLEDGAVLPEPAGDTAAPLHEPASRRGRNPTAAQGPWPPVRR